MRAWLIIADGAAGVRHSRCGEPRDAHVRERAGHSRQCGGGCTRSGSLLSVADGVAGLTLIDVSDPSAPELISTTATPAQSVAVASDERYAYLGQANEGGLAIFDLANPQMPIQVGSFQPPEPTLAVALAGHIVYCLSDPKSSWLNIVDALEPDHPFTDQRGERRGRRGGCDSGQPLRCWPR